MDDLMSDLAWFDVIVGGNCEWWSIGGSLDGSDDFWRWSRRGCLSRRVNKGGGRGREFVGEDIGSDGRHVVGRV